MATFVNDLRLTELATGEGSGTWGDTTNTNLELISSAMGHGAEAIANASTHTITMADGADDEFRSTFLRLTGGGQACTVTLAPNTLSHTWIMRNETNSTLTLTQGSGANVAISAGQTKIVATDGAGSGAVVYELDDLELAGNMLIGGTLGVTGVVTANAGVVVDNITIDGTEIDSSSSLILDVAGNLTINVDGTTITLADDTINFGQFFNNSSGQFNISAPTQDKDIVFLGNDGGSTITALTLDMSNAGAATFNGTVTANAGVVVDNITIDGNEIDVSSGNFTLDVAGDISFDADGQDIKFLDGGTEYGKVRFEDPNFVIKSSVQDGDILFKGDDGGSTILALKLDMSAAGAATFNAGATLGGNLVVGGADNADIALFHGTTGGTARGLKISLATDGATNQIVNLDSLQSSGILAFKTAGTERGRFTSSGLEVTGTIAATSATFTRPDNSDNLTLVSTDADASAGPNLRMYRNSASPADSDELGNILFQGRNDNSQDVVYATIETFALDVSDGTEDAVLNFNVMKGGSSVSFFKGNNTEVVVNDDSNDLDFRVESNSNANMLVVDAGNDRVGVGTGSPSHTMHVVSSGNGEIKVERTSGAAILLQSQSAAGKIGTSTNHGLGFNTNGTTRVTIDTNGKVLINDSSSHTSDFLQIETPASGGGHGIQIRRNDANGDQTVGAITFGNNTDTDLAQISAKTDGDGNSGDSGALLFSTQTTGGSLTERLRITSTGSLAKTSGDLTIDVAGDITLDADGGDIVFADGGSSIGRFKNNSGNFVIKSEGSDDDLIFKGNDGGSEITALSFDMSASGSATFNNSIIVGNKLFMADNKAISFGAGEDLTIKSDGTNAQIAATNDIFIDAAGQISLDSDNAGSVKLLDGGTFYGQFFEATNSFYIESKISDGDIILRGNDGGSTITALTLDMSDGGVAFFNDDVRMNDAKVLRFGDDQDFRISFDSHAIIQNVTSDSDIIFKGNDGGSTITALTLDMSNAGAATFNSSITSGGFVGANGHISTNSNSGNLRAGLTHQIEISHNGSHGEIDVDTGNLTLDVVGDILLDADGGDITLMDGGTEFAHLTNSSSDFLIQSAVNDKDIIFKGVDNSSVITALTLDMSAAGAASFNAGGTFGGAVTINTTASGDGIRVVSTNADAASGPNLTLMRDSSSPADNDGLASIIFSGDDSAGNETSYASISASVLDVTDGTEDSRVSFMVRSEAAARSAFILDGTSGATFNEDGIAAGDFRVESNGNTHMFFVDSNVNRIGVGATPLTNGSTFQVTADATESDNVQLTLRGATDINKQMIMGFDTTANTAHITTQIAGSAPTDLIFKTGDVVFNENSVDADFRAESDGNTHMLFVDAGNNAVNIGTVTHLGEVLNVSGGAHLTSNVIFSRQSNDAGSTGLIMEKTRSTTVNGNTVVNSGDQLGFIGFKGNDGDQFVDGAFIIANVDGTPGNNDMPTSLSFHTTADGASSVTQRMIIDSQGFVGMGEPDPQAHVHVLGNNDSDGATLILQEANNNTADTLGTVFFGNNVNDNLARILCFTSGSTTTSTLRFMSTADGATAVNNLDLASSNVTFNENSNDMDFRVESNGNANAIFLDANSEFVSFGKNTTALTTTGISLNLAGTATFAFDLTSENEVFILNNNNSTGTIYKMDFRQNNTSVGRITATSSGLSLTSGSDYRLKENVTELTGATDRLKQLTPKRFNFIDEPDITVDGFLAHEVSSIVPEAIDGEKDAVDADGNPKYQCIDQSKLVPLLVATIKELEARIAALES